MKYTPFHLCKTYVNQCSSHRIINLHCLLIIQWIDLRELLQESPIFNGKTYGFLWFPVDFPLNQSIELYMIKSHGWPKSTLGHLPGPHRRRARAPARWVSRPRLEDILSGATGHFSGVYGRYKLLANYG